MLQQPVHGTLHIIFLSQAEGVAAIATVAMAAQVEQQDIETTLLQGRPNLPESPMEATPPAAAAPESMHQDDGPMAASMPEKPAAEPHGRGTARGESDGHKGHAVARWVRTK